MNSYFSWPSIFGGAVVAVALSVILQNFGTGVGLAYDPEWLERSNAMVHVWVGGLWLLLMALASSTAGGYIAGRMRPRWTDAKPEEVEIRDGCNGLAVWAVSTLAVGAIAIFGAAAAATAAAATGTSDEAQQIVPALVQNGSSVVAFATAAGSALGAAAAWFAAKLGGEHRDENVPLANLTPRFLRR